MAVKLVSIPGSTARAAYPQRKDSARANRACACPIRGDTRVARGDRTRAGWIGADRRSFLSICTLVVALVAPGSVFAQPSVQVKFEVDVADRLEQSAESVLRTNVVAYVSESVTEGIWNKFLSEQRVGDVLLDTVDITRDSTDFQDLRRRMRTLDGLVRRIVAGGGRVQLVFQNGIPRWLSSDPRNDGDLFQGGLSEGQKIWHSVPPADYRRWEEIAHAFVHHFNRELDTGGRVYYVVGSEPENYWVGDEQQWHRYYEHFVKGALAADPDAKIGGINTVGLSAMAFTRSRPRRTGDGAVVFESLPARGDKGILYNWLEFSARNRLPVDVVTWHDYPAPSPVPRDTANWVVAEKQLQQWLSRFGYSGAELILNDWPEWKPVPEENDSEFQAAYVTSSLISMIQDTGVKALYLGLQDLGAYTASGTVRSNASFGGGNGMFTRLGLAKPVYNAYALMSQMQGQLLRVHADDEFVRALVTATDDAVYILLSNFIPSQRIVLQNSYGVEGGVLDESDRSALREAVKRSGMSRREIVAKLLDGQIDIDNQGLPAAVVKKAQGARSVVLEGRRRLQAPAHASVRVTGLAGGAQRWTQEEYIIDGTRANAYSMRAQLLEQAKSLGLDRGDRGKLRQFVEQVNARTGIDSSMRSGEDVVLRGSTLDTTTTLEPNSVHLIVLRRAPAG